MSDKGYVYVLVNPSMEGYVKIGKTKRKPEVRVQELSQATGVPTPFILAYAACVNDCSHAETYLHTFFETKGKRVSDNREFFDVTTTEAIDAIHQYQNEFGIAVDNGDIEDDGIEDNGEPPWVAIEFQAEKYYVGLGETLQDYKKAFSLYQQAVKLGSSTASRMLAYMYGHGQGCQEDDEKALEYYSIGIESGDYYCYGDMAMLYFRMGHIENALKCIDQYMDTVDDIDKIVATTYIEQMYKMNLPIKHLPKLREFKEEIFKWQDKLIDSIKVTGNYKLVIVRETEERIREYMKYIFGVEQGNEVLCGQDYEAKLKVDADEKEKKRANNLLKVCIVVFVIVFLIAFIVTYGSTSSAFPSIIISAMIAFGVIFVVVRAVW